MNKTDPYEVLGIFPNTKYTNLEVKAAYIAVKNLNTYPDPLKAYQAINTYEKRMNYEYSKNLCTNPLNIFR